MPTDTYIPARRRAHCEGCGETVDVEAPGVAQRVTGWAVNRSQGGANAIALRQPERRWLCQFCLANRKKGIITEQETMF